MGHRTIESLLLLGRDHQAYGELFLQGLRRSDCVAAISAGADEQSPSLAHKGQGSINEDAALCMSDGERTLLALADAHHGDEASAHLLREVERLAHPLPTRAERLRQLLLAIEPGDANRLSASTLLVAVCDQRRRGFGINYGDTTLLALGARGVRPLSQTNVCFLAPAEHEPMPLSGGSPFAFDLERGELLVGYTDGVNECHYGSPGTSIQDRHLEALFARHGSDLEAFARALGSLALAGVDDMPGGQDNIALLVHRPRPI